MRGGNGNSKLGGNHDGEHGAKLDAESARWSHERHSVEDRGKRNTGDLCRVE